MLWKILEQIPHSRLGLLAKVVFGLFVKCIFLFGTTDGSYALNVQGLNPTGYYRYFKVAYSQTKTDAEILQYASEYNLADNEYFFDRYES